MIIIIITITIMIIIIIVKVRIAFLSLRRSTVDQVSQRSRAPSCPHIRGSVAGSVG